MSKGMKRREGAPTEALPSPRSQGKSVLQEYAEALIIAVLLALVIRTFVVQAFKIPSGSMLPTLQIGDFIKRVIGLPGETLEIRGKQILINGKPLDEPYAVYGDWSVPRLGDREQLGPIVIPPGRLFMMGDNRDHSMDSRVWGFLDTQKVKGKAFIVYFSVKSDDIPYTSALPSVFYVLSHPSMIRWNRLGGLVH